MYQLLKGMTVIEGAAFVAGPSCGLHLAQMGATVIRFDQIGGGPDYRRWPISTGGESLYWEGLNKGKLSIAIDLSHAEGRTLALSIATSADGLFVTNFPERSFLSYEKLAALRDDLICLRIMGWADGTPAVDYTINAAIGLPMMTGPANNDHPVNHVLPAWDLLAGAYAAFALMAAERDRMKSGRGREIRVALSDLAAATMGNLGAVAETILHGDRPRSGNDLFGAFGRDFVTASGARLMIVAITPRQWAGLVEVLGIADDVAAVEARLGVNFTADEGARFTHRHVLNPIVERAVAMRDAAELGAAFDAKGVCWSQYRTLSGALADDPRFFDDNPIFTNVKHPSGRYPTPGSAARLPGDTRETAQPAHGIGQDTDRVLAEFLGMSSAEISHLHDKGIVA
jgi:2-methylfumaryl-CoA isomerase